MSKDITVVFNWANTLGDANINNRILAKVMPEMIKEKIKITDTMIKSGELIEVSEDTFELIKKSAESLLDATYPEEK